MTSANRFWEWDIWVKRNIWCESTEDHDFMAMIYRALVVRTDDECHAEPQTMTDRACDRLRDHSDWRLPLTGWFDGYTRTRQ